MNTTDSELDALALRELAICALAGAQIACGTTTLLPRSLTAERATAGTRNGTELLAAAVAIATVMYLFLSGG